MSRTPDPWVTVHWTLSARRWALLAATRYRLVRAGRSRPRRQTTKESDRAPTADRRSHPRVSFSSPIEVVQGNHHLPSCPVVDIAEGGLRLATELPSSDPVTLLVSLPGSDRTRASLVKGEVVWREREATGIRFTAVSSKTTGSIRDLQRAETDRRVSEAGDEP